MTEKPPSNVSESATTGSTDPDKPPSVISTVIGSGGWTQPKSGHSKTSYSASGNWQNQNWNANSGSSNFSGPPYMPSYPPPPLPPHLGWPPFPMNPPVIPGQYPENGLSCPPSSAMIPPFPPPPNLFPPNAAMVPPFPPPSTTALPPRHPQGNYPMPYMGPAPPNQSNWAYYSGPPSSATSSWKDGPNLPPTCGVASGQPGNSDKQDKVNSAKYHGDNRDGSQSQSHFSNSKRDGSNFSRGSRDSERLRKPSSDHRNESTPRHREDSRSRKWSRSPVNSRRTSDRSRRSKSGERRSRDRSRSPVGSISRDRSKSRGRDSPSNDRNLFNKSTSEQRMSDRRREIRSNRSKVNSRKSSSVGREHETQMDADIPEDKELHDERTEWIRCSPADLYYDRSSTCLNLMRATHKLIALHDRFKSELLDRGAKARVENEEPEPIVKKTKVKSPKLSDSSDSESGEMSFGESSDDEEIAMRELERKKHHPNRLHEELWYNDPGQMNDGPLCRCSLKARRSGIRHGIYPGESHLEKCDPHSNNHDRLFHYRITMSPHTNFLTKFPTIIKHDDHEFIFEGFSMLSHYKIGKLPTCKVIRFNIEYTIHYIEEKIPENFTICGVQIFSDYLFNEILELVDLDLRAHGDDTGCKRFHFFPRFARAIEENGKEILSMNVVQKYLLDCNKPLVEEADIPRLMKMSEHEWQDFTEKVKGMIVTYPGKKPSSLRVDQLDRDVGEDGSKFPEIVHFGIRPLQLSYAGNPSYQKAWREYVKYRHLLANKPKVSYQDRHKLMQKEMRLQEMRTKNNLKRDVTVVVSSKGFYRTGIMCDIVQHAMLLPVLVCHLRFHKSLDILEERIGHKFQDRYLLQLALTHPSYRENFGTNPDHARNALTNCGIRQPEYGDRRIHYANTRKRGINTLINIMSRFGKPQETVSNINHNERLEFLGDAVVEFLTSIHLFHLFPDIEEGGLATYRAAIVQNQHLAVLAKKLQLDQFMLYAHGSDLCHDLELRHAMANCFEALMGALFLDGEVDAADRVFSNTLFDDSNLREVWVDYPSHPIQEQEPDGDRKWIVSVPLLKKVMKFEEAIGMQFNHIRLLARAFTHRSVGFNNLTLGSNQRLEFLGDTVLQLVASEYLYKFFPEHHEGHLSLLRSSLVNNRTQAVVCDDLGMVDYAIYAYPKGDLKIKDRADLLEAFLGALYVDQGLDYCRVFCQVCFFPRLQQFIMNQDWNDPKSKLQQCCLTLRTMDGGEPDIPYYKVIESKGPTNTRIFTVAVYFRGKRLAKGSGHSIQLAEMAAANRALKSSSAELFPQLNHQRRVIERSMKQHQKRNNAENMDYNTSATENQPSEDSEVKNSRQMSWCI